MFILDTLNNNWIYLTIFKLIKKSIAVFNNYMHDICKIDANF